MSSLQETTNYLAGEFVLHAPSSPSSRASTPSTDFGDMPVLAPPVDEFVTPYNFSPTAQSFVIRARWDGDGRSDSLVISDLFDPDIDGKPLKFVVVGKPEKVECGPLGDMKDGGVVDEYDNMPELVQYVLQLTPPSDALGAAKFAEATHNLLRVQAKMSGEARTLRERNRGVVWSSPDGSDVRLLLATPVFHCTHSAYGFEVDHLRLRVYNKNGHLIDPYHADWCVKNSKVAVHFTLNHNQFGTHTFCADIQYIRIVE
ncbi:hypothetical protein BDN72DRAFT_897377 [Pluteus cervinus]|uniref:Uncharacterized protein n=1 Tax=Pluteus cervinus TaxID=181527 RepID=A0ACD3AV86_9AGAR|nr:hypothetical protein BDN72DRAFT_897377 [Pluteus cervinus]